MRETLRWIGYLIVTTFVLVALVFTAYRIRGPSHAQREALALMQKDYRPKAGTNAFPVLWYLEYDVPESEIAKRFAAEVDSVRAGLAAGVDQMNHSSQADKLAETAGDPSRLCESRARQCLAEARANPVIFRETLATYPVIRAREASFEATDYYWNDFSADFRSVLAAVPRVAERVWLSAHALRYVDGDRAGALADTCRNLDAWRRVRRGTNSLIGSMVSIAAADGAMQLFADMLAALPPGEEVPSVCSQALAPIEAGDVDRCAEMAGEFAIDDSAIGLALERRDASLHGGDRLGRWFLFSKPQWEGWLAERGARYCEEPPTDMLADVPRPPAASSLTNRLECVSSLDGCLMAEIRASTYDNHDARTLDYAAHLRLTSALLWLRETASDEPLARRFDKRPDTLRSGNRASGYDAATGTLYVDDRYGVRAGRFVLRVAAAHAHGS